VVKINYANDKIQPALIIYPTREVGVLYTEIEIEGRNTYLSENEEGRWGKGV